MTEPAWKNEDKERKGSLDMKDGRKEGARQRQESCAVTSFKNEEFGSVRMALEEEGFLFCGADVASALGYAKPGNAIRRHCRGARKRCTLTNGGVQELVFIPEGDVYRLIINSRLPGAERFERWVFEEVLPEIRRTGIYEGRGPQEQEDRKALLRFARQLLAEDEENQRLTARITELEPKAAYYDAFFDPGECTNIRGTAKELDIPERRFCRFLLDAGFLYRSPDGSLLPYAKKQREGLFAVRDYRADNGHIGTQTLITPKGKALFCRLAGGKREEKEAYGRRFRRAPETEA